MRPVFAIAPSWMMPEKVDDPPWLVRTASGVPLFVTVMAAALAAQKALPHAIQVADRWHLIRNVSSSGWRPHIGPLP